MRSANVNLTPLLDVLFIILFVIMGQNTEEVKSKVNRIEDDHSKLEASYAELEDKEKLSERKREELEQDYLKLQRRKKELEDDLEKERQVKKDLEAENERLAGELAEEKEEHSGAREKIKEQESFLAALRKKFKQISEQLEKEKIEKEKLQKEKEELNQQIAYFQEEIARFENELEKVKKEKTVLEKDLEQQRQVCKTLEDKIRKLNAKLVVKIQNEELLKIQKAKAEDAKEELKQQMKEMERILKGRDLHRTVLKSQILSENFSLYEITLLKEKGATQSTRITFKRPDGKIIDEVIMTREDFVGTFKRAIPKAVRYDAKNSIFMVFLEGEVMIAHRRWTEEELQKIEALYGIRRIE